MTAVDTIINYQILHCEVDNIWVSDATSLSIIDSNVKYLRLVNTYNISIRCSKVCLSRSFH